MPPTPAGTSMVEVWTSAAWRHEVDRWIRASVANAGHRVTGDIEQVRVRVWSTQLTVPTTAGRLWFKENHPGQRAEAAIVDELSRLAPDYVVVPLAVERERGWLLTPDHGDTLATLDGHDEALWCRVVAEYGDLQRRAASGRDDLVAAGLQPLLPSMAADHVEAVITDMRGRSVGDAIAISPERADSALAALPRIREIGDRLSSTGPALESLEHNDLHQNNVFIPHPDEVTLRFFDFGDALWAHPFTSMTVPVANLCHDWDTEDDDPRVQRVVDAYLDGWSDLADRSALRETVALARRLGPIHRFESWRRLLDGSPVTDVAEHAENLRYWVARVAEIEVPT